MPYVIQHVPSGKLVTVQGYRTSYTRDLRMARLYPTREQADRERCVENERVIPLLSLFGTEGPVEL